MSSVTDFSDFSIKFLNKQINCKIPENFFLHDVFTLYPQADNPDANLVIEEAEGPLRTRVFSEHGIINMMTSGENAFNMNLFRSYVGFLLHYLTPAFFLHGCGIYSLLKQKGILLAGEKGSGKTTLSREIPASSIIDDDQMLIHNDEIICIGKKAAHTVKKKSAQKVIYESKGYLSADLGLILILTRDLKGGQVREVKSESIIKQPSVYWHHNLSTIKCPENYCEGKKIPDVPAFLLGTDENKKETIDTMMKKIDSILS